MLADKTREIFAAFNRIDQFERHDEIYGNLLKRVEPVVTAQPRGQLGDLSRIRAYSLTYRQALLHRSILLYRGALDAASEHNPYSMVLSIRGHFETTAALAYLHKRLQSLKAKTISPETLDSDLCALMLGSRQKGLNRAPDAKQVLNLIEAADRSISRDILDGPAKQHMIMRESYEFLSEFCHPNLFANSIAFDLDSSASEFRFRHEMPIREREFNLVGYLLISASIFIEIFDYVEKLLPARVKD
jgi:hypothetical protein